MLVAECVGIGMFPMSNIATTRSDNIVCGQAPTKNTFCKIHDTQFDIGMKSELENIDVANIVRVFENTNTTNLKKYRNSRIFTNFKTGNES